MRMIWGELLDNDYISKILIIKCPSGHLVVS